MVLKDFIILEHDTASLGNNQILTFEGLYCLHLQVSTYPRRIIFLLGHLCSEQMD